MPSAPVIALLTDFGIRDPFVGIMKAVILARCPTAQIIDLTHAVEPQSVSIGALWLSLSFEWLPPKSVLVAVVDPGVGSGRRAIVVESQGRVVVAPDNGLAAWAAGLSGARAFEVDVDRLGLGIPSRTFHGRDVFAPVGALIASGSVVPENVGPPASDLVKAPLRAPKIEPTGVSGEVVLVDHFGNLFTNVTGALARDIDASVVVSRDVRAHIVATYSDAEIGGLLALENAFGLLEIARRDGDARAHTGLDVGSPIWVPGRPRA